MFKGTVTYASVPLETVDWGRFDVVAVDLYRDARIRDHFSDLLRRFFVHGRPVVITEFGCCTYRGAADAGGTGWAIVDLDIAEPESDLRQLEILSLWHREHGNHAAIVWFRSLLAEVAADL